MPSEAEEELQDKVWGIYCNGLGEDYNFYAREADKEGLVAVYETGIQVGVTYDRKKLKAVLDRLENELNKPPIVTKSAFGGEQLNEAGYQMAVAIKNAYDFLLKLYKGETDD